MGKSIAAGIVIALVAGAAIGYFILPMVFPTQAVEDRQTYFVDQHNGTFAASALMEDIDYLNITVTTQEGDVLELFYSSNLIFEPSTIKPTLQTAVFQFAIDGIPVAETYKIQVLTNSTDWYQYAVCYRYIVTSITPSTHNISVQVQAYGTLTGAGPDGNVLSIRIL